MNGRIYNSFDVSMTMMKIVQRVWAASCEGDQ